MTLVDIDETIAEKINIIIEKNKIEYPSFKNFVNKVLKEKIEKEGL